MAKDPCNVWCLTPIVTWNSDGGIHEIPLPPGAQGRLWLCGKHVIGPDPEGLLERVGADAVVCLTQEHELAERYPDYVDWLRAQPATRVIWWPIHDLHAPDRERFEPVLADVVARLSAGTGVVVHCAAGIGRAGTTAVAVLVSMGMPLDEALEHVRSHRPSAGPEAGTQLELVRDLAEAMAAGRSEIRLYDGPAPGSEGWTHSARRYWSELWDTEVVANVVVPTITPVLPTGEATGLGVIVAPGGGFHALSIDSEGFAVADRLAAAGIASFVLKYRTVPGGDDPVADMVDKMARIVDGDVRVFDDMAAAAPLAGADGMAAMRLVRERAGEFGVDPGRLGFMGFSAGGNVAVRAAYADDPGARPDWTAPIYAITSGLELGEPPVGSGTMFLAVATDDALGLTGDSIALYERWRGANLPVELHAYAQGGHGFGMRTNNVPADTWIDRFIDWSSTFIGG